MKTNRELDAKLSSLRITLRHADDKHQKTYITAQINLLEWILGVQQEFSYGVVGGLSEHGPANTYGLQQVVRQYRPEKVYGPYKRVKKSKAAAA